MESRFFLIGLPQAGEIFQIALDLGLALADAGGADDEADIFRRIELVENLPQAAALVLVLDLAADALADHAGHHHQDLAGDGQIGAERRALGADAFLDDLHDDLIAAAQAALDGRAIAPGHLLADRFLHVLALAAEIGRQQVGDVQEAVAAQAKVDERRLNRRLDVHHLALVDVIDVGGGAGSLHVKFFEHSVFHEGDSAFFALGDVNQHFLCHS